MYRKKQKIKKNKIIFTCVLLFCLIIGFVVNVLTTNRQFTIIEKAIKDAVLTVQKVISYPIDFIANKIDENSEKDKMYDEYNRLKEQLAQNEIYKIENEELKKQLSEMKKLLSINDTLAEYTYMNATVIGRDLGYFYDTITINKGEHDGVTLDMPVVIGGKLIGKVISTTTFNSTVRLITATDVVDKISVKIKTQDTYVYGILSRYDATKIENGYIVTTTGMGDIFPAGIVIGKVTGVTTDSFDLSNVLEVKSDVNFDSIDFVTILKRNI